MLVPFGILLKCIGVEKYKNAAVAGLAVSLLIETLQFTLAIGTFEFDDVIHNTMGTVFGYYIMTRINPELRIELSIHTTSIILISITIFASIPFVCKEMQHQKLIQYAAQYDRDDGTKNLLVLYGDNGRTWDTDVHIKYLNDGAFVSKALQIKDHGGP